MTSPIHSLCRAALQISVLATGAVTALAVKECPQLLLGPVALLVLAKLNRQIATTSKFGSARWGTHADAAAAGLTNNLRGLPLGYLQESGKPELGKALQGLFFGGDSEVAVRTFLAALNMKVSANDPLRLADGVHACIISPPGGGKTTALLINALLTDSSPSVTICPKGEITKVAVPARKKRFGRKAYVIDPYQLVMKNAAKHNPLHGLDLMSAEGPEELLDLANALVMRTGHEEDPHWPDSAEAMIAAMMAFALICGKDKQNLLAVQDLIGDNELRKGALDKMMKSDHPAGAILRKFALQIQHLKDREEGSVLSTALRNLNFLNSPAITNVVKESSFDLNEVIRGNADLYIVMPPDRMRGPQAGFLRLMLTSVVRRLFRAGVSNSRRVIFYLDETACLGAKLTALEQLLTVGRGYGARAILAYQSRGQLLAGGDQAAAQTLLSCLNCQIFLGAPNDYETAEYLQNLLGDQTIPIVSQQQGDSTSSGSSTSAGGSQPSQRQYSHNSSNSGSATYSEQGRKLMFASEALTDLGPGKAIVILPGKCRPLLTRMLRYFEDPACLGSGGGQQLWMLVLSLILLGFSVLSFTAFLEEVMHIPVVNVVKEYLDRLGD